MTTEETAFWRNILADPEDRLRRLVYCDWLDERGDPRAEGLRVLTEYDRWPVSIHHWGGSKLGPIGYAFWVYSNDLRSELPKPWWDLWRRRAPAVQYRTASDAVVTSSAYRHARKAVEAAALAWADLSDRHRRVCQRVLDFKTGRSTDPKDRQADEHYLLHHHADRKPARSFL